ncbi:MAG: DUF6350 family protein [Microbacterium sp.]
MQRVLIALLSALDAVIHAAIGLAAALATLTVLWTFEFGGATADWGALWPASARIWQLGQFVPLRLRFDDAAVVALGIPDGAASFVISLAPLAFGVFAVIFAARSGARAVRSGAWVTAALGGIATTAVISTLVQLTSSNPVAAASWGQAILLPVLVYAAGLICGVMATGWTSGDDGPIDLLHEWCDRWPSMWRELPGIAVRGAAVGALALVAASALGVVVTLAFHADTVVSLYQSAQVDVPGVIALSLAQLAYLPTLIAWALAWLAGPGFAIGAGTAVSPAGTELGVIPSIPLLGLVPRVADGWFLLVCLVPVAAGALAGWLARGQLSAEWEIDPPVASEFENERAPEPVLPRAVLAVGIAALAAGFAALVAVASSGAIGPDRLSTVGPHPAELALAVGVEVLLGAAILLLGPRRRA